MNSQFYVARQGEAQRQGPFTREQLEQGLQTGQFRPEDLAWQSGTADWVPLPTLLMPALPSAPPVPGMPPLPASSVPPPPPFERTGSYAPPPPYQNYAPQNYAPARGTWSPLGLIAFFLALAGIGLLSWLCFELWEATGPAESPMLGEAAVAWIGAAFGVLVLGLALPHLLAKPARRGRAWAVISVVLGAILTLGGVGGAIFAEDWASIRQRRQERLARVDVLQVGSLLREYAQAHGGRYPNTIEQLRAADQNADLTLHHILRRSDGTRKFHLAPGLSQSAAPDTILLADSWRSERGNRAIYKANGDTDVVGYPVPLINESSNPAPLATNFPLSGNALPKGIPPVVGQSDLGSAQQTLQTLLTAGRNGDLQTIRRCTTEIGFNKEFAGTTIERMRSEFNGLNFTVKRVGVPQTAPNGRTMAEVVVSISENGRSMEEAFTFEVRGNDWLLHAM